MPSLYAVTSATMQNSIVLLKIKLVVTGCRKLKLSLYLEIVSATMPRTKENQKDTDRQQSLSSFGFKGGSVANKGADRSESTSNESEQDKTSKNKQKQSDSLLPIIIMHFQEKWTLKFAWLYRSSNGSSLCSARPAKEPTIEKPPLETKDWLTSRDRL